MGYEDRPYFRDQNPMPGGPLMWLLAGSVHLFTVFGIRVRAHASLIVTIGLVLLLGLGGTFSRFDSFQSMVMLFVIVLLHEFGHCFAARWVGGTADEVMMTPLGGMAFTGAPRRWWPTLVTVLGGPAVNVLLCLISGLVLWGATGSAPWNPLRIYPFYFQPGMLNLLRWDAWLYQVSWFLLIFNMLPIYPMDGGQALQAVLWKIFGYYRSMNFACITGMIGSVLMAGLAIASSSLFLLLIGVFGFLTCMQTRAALLADGPYAFSDEDFNPGSFRESSKSQKANKTKAARAQKLVQAERDEQKQIDDILAKVSASGMQSLSGAEKRALQKATENQRKRDLELSKLR